MKKVDQNGFAVIEAFLVIVILGIIGFTGWFVWHAKQSTDKTLSNTANSQPALQAKKKASTPTSEQKYVAITEWGVKVPVDAEHNDVVYCYEKRDSGEAYVYFSATSLGGISKQPDGTCGNSFGSLSRYKIGDTQYANGQSYEVTAETVKDAPKVGEYYYFFETSHATSNDKQDNYEAYLVEDIKNIEAL